MDRSQLQAILEKGQGVYKAFVVTSSGAQANRFKIYNNGTGDDILVVTRLSIQVSTALGVWIDDSQTASYTTTTLPASTDVGNAYAPFTDIEYQANGTAATAGSHGHFIIGTSGNGIGYTPIITPDQPWIIRSGEQLHVMAASDQVQQEVFFEGYEL